MTLIAISKKSNADASFDAGFYLSDYLNRKPCLRLVVL